MTSTAKRVHRERTWRPRGHNYFRPPPRFLVRSFLDPLRFYHHSEDFDKMEIDNDVGDKLSDITSIS